MSDEKTNAAVEGEQRPPDTPLLSLPGGEQSAVVRAAGGEPVTSDSVDEVDPGFRLPFNVVGIGASAGGVEASIELFEHLDPDTGMAYVLVAHLSPDQKSHLCEILTRHTSMPVEEIAAKTALEANRLYVAPPGVLLRVSRGELHCDPMESATGQRAIDYFFHSLAADQKNRSIGIVLSGMDSDGALGMRAIKGEGGITMVQAPQTAQFPDMPRSSISVDHVDIIAAPSELAGQLSQLGRQFREASVRILAEGGRLEGDDHDFARVLALMRTVSGVDFRLYKPQTIRRRVARRMLLHRVPTLREYAGFLQRSPGELAGLQEDSLINVTEFFRDPDMYAAFSDSMLPHLFEGRDPSQQIRMWVAGCSTGEEVYSFAICLLEYLTTNALEPPIQIFGTDASEFNIEKARTGFYPASIAEHVSPERLRRFFTRAERGYQVSKRVRDLCIFARQNLCNDPPFSRIDVTSCRNVLIYFGSELQRQLIPMFHYALRPGGFLILGTSETIRDFTDLFSLADRKHKFYSRTAGAGTRAMFDMVPRGFYRDVPAHAPAARTDGWEEGELQRAADRILIARFLPPAVVVNEHLEVIHSRGRMSPFLELPPGTASLDLLRMTRDTIAHKVSAAVRRAIEEDIPVQVDGLQVSDGEMVREATLEVLPVHSVGRRSKCYLVVFAPAHPDLQHHPPPVELPPGTVTDDKDRLIAKLRHDLSSTRMYLQSLLEERDAKNQELVSANEEIQSANEELQSTNEELETTKEELQSSNEELHTVNDELQTRNTVLTQASNDLFNLLTSVNLPVVMLSNEMNIRQFTPPTQRVMNLRSTDIGRPFTEIRSNLNVDDLTPVFREVLDSLTPREVEVRDREGHWYLLRMRPYRTADNRIDGLVIALVDIDEVRRTGQELRSARDFARSIIAGVPLPLTVVDTELRIRATNQAFSQLSGLSANSCDRRYLPALAHTLWGLGESFEGHLAELRETRTVGARFEFEHVSAGQNSREFIVCGSVLQPHDEQFLLVTIQEVTSQKEAQRKLTSEAERLAREVHLTAEALGKSREELRALAASLFTSQEEERRRIARELHDDVSQRLAALEIDAGDALNRTPDGSADAKEAIERIRARLSELSDDVRAISHRLHPSVIEDLGLVPALQSLTEDFGRRENMIGTFASFEVPQELPLEVSTALYRIAQEALRNVSKHAGQTHVRVSLKGTPEGLQLQVADFGYGFDMEAKRSGLGLVSMEERARQIGAGMDVYSALGEGTRVTVTVPPPALPA